MDEVTIQPRYPLWRKPLNSSLFALVWCFATALMVNHISRRRPWTTIADWLVALAVLAFVVCGVVLIIAAVRSVLANFNPRPVLTFSKISTRVGEPLTVRWKFLGNTMAVRRLHIWLQCHESVRRSAAKPHLKKDREISRVDLLETSDQQEIPTGQIDFAIPLERPAAIETSDAERKWLLHIEGEVAWWPDVQVVYPLLVDDEHRLAS